MTDPNLRRKVEDSLDKGAGIKRYAAYYKGRLLSVWKVTYERRGVLVNRVKELVGHHLYNACNYGVKWDDPNLVPWAQCQEEGKKLTDELIKDGTIEIKEI